jgi:hypothetical protein
MHLYSWRQDTVTAGYSKHNGSIIRKSSSSLRGIAEGKTVGGKVEKRIQSSASKKIQSRRLLGEGRSGMDRPKRESKRSMKANTMEAPKVEKQNSINREP